MTVEWDDAKSRANLRKHGVSFQEAAYALDDSNAIEGVDESHSRKEPRFWVLGMSPRQRILLVIFTEREGEIVRIITAWKANREEKKLYEEENRRD